MFEFGESYSINKKTIVDLFPEKTLARDRSDPDFINERPQHFASPQFTYLGCDVPETCGREVKEEDLYEDNGGTTVAVISENKIIIASDTRHSGDYTINSRNMTKIFRIGDFFLAVVGFYPDGFEVYTRLMYAMKSYETHGKITLKALAHYLHNVLYSRRFFPLYTYATLCGYEDGRAKIYSYDAVGSYDEELCVCKGSGAPMIQPLLDSWISGKNFKGFNGISFDQTLELIKKAFDGAAERDVKTKDSLEVYIIDGSEIRHEIVPLRKD